MNNVSQSPQVFWMDAQYKSLAVSGALYHFLRSSSVSWKQFLKGSMLNEPIVHQIFGSWQRVSKPTTVITHKPGWLFWTLVIFEFEFGQSDSQWLGVDIFLIGQILYWQGISSLK